MIDVTERSSEEKAHALEIYERDGLAATHRQTGIPKPTLHDWARAAGLDVAAIAGDTATKTLAATAARSARCDALRSELKERLLETAATLLDRVDHPHTEFKGNAAKEVHYDVAPADACRNYVTAAAICIDKYRLEVGEATDRVDVTGTAPVGARERLAEVVELELALRAS